MKYNHALNRNEITGKIRGTNQLHWVYGIAMPQNYHATKFDTAQKPRLRRPFPSGGDLDGPGADRHSNPMRPRSQVPAKPGGNAYDRKAMDILTCEACHASSHGGNVYVGTSLLRDGSVLDDAVVNDSAPAGSASAGSFGSDSGTPTSAMTAKGSNSGVKRIRRRTRRFTARRTIIRECAVAAQTFSKLSLPSTPRPPDTPPRAATGSSRSR